MQVPLAAFCVCASVLCCRWLWDRPQHLTQLLDAAQQRMDAWVSTQQRQHGSAWARHSLNGLLQGFFAFYSDLFMDWVLGKRR